MAQGQQEGITGGMQWTVGDIGSIVLPNLVQISIQQTANGERRGSGIGGIQGQHRPHTTQIGGLQAESGSGDERWPSDHAVRRNKRSTGILVQGGHESLLRVTEGAIT